MGEKKQEKEPSGGDGLGGLLSSLTGGEGPGSIDPALLLKAGQAISKMNGQPDDRYILLNALKPYLRRERQERIDEAVRILNLLRLAEVFRS